MQGNLIKSFIEASSEFKKSKASEKSIEKLYDLLYALEKRNRDTDETVMLLQIYKLLGLRIKAYRVFQTIKLLPENEQKKFAKLLGDFDNDKHWNGLEYRDLRDARAIKKTVGLTADDFILSKADDALKVTFRDDISHLVVLNKNIKIKDVIIYLEDGVNDFMPEELADYLLWLGDCKDELLNFYSAHEIEYKHSNPDTNWFDGLDVWEVCVTIKEGKIASEIFITDYYHPNRMGFCLETNGQEISSVQYDPIL